MGLDKCECIAYCRDTRELKRGIAEGVVDEDLIDQYYELCTNGCALMQGTLICLSRNKYLQNK